MSLVARRIGRILLLAVALLLIWIPVSAALVWHYGNVDYARPSDCAIVLGAAAYHRRPSPVFAERIRHAIDLYKKGQVNSLIFTGGYGTGAPYAESEVARTFAIDQGVPASAILIETASRTTIENLREAAHVMRREGLSSAIIVSDPLHLTRAAWIARDLGINAVTSPTPTSRFRSWTTRLSFLARETYFLHRYALLGI